MRRLGEAHEAIGADEADGAEEFGVALRNYEEAVRRNPRLGTVLADRIAACRAQAKGKR